MKLDFDKPLPGEKLKGIRTFLAVLGFEAAYVTEATTIRHFRDAVTHKYGNAQLTLEELAKKLGIAAVAENDLLVDVLARMREAKA